LKKIFSITALFIFVLYSIMNGRFVFAEKNFLPEIQASHGIAIEVNSGRILFQKDAFKKVPIASTTKIMTALVALERGDMDQIFEVSNRGAWVGGSTMGLKQRERVSLEELLYGLLLKSGNDAAVTIAEGIAGSVEDFALMMNQKGKEIGLRDTNFVTPHGLDSDGQYSTAYDLALLMKVAILNKTFATIVGTKEIVFSHLRMVNTNPLLGIYPGVDGGKTGYTSKAGRCLVLSARRGSLHIITVFLNAPTSQKRIESARKVLDYVFYEYGMVRLIAKNELIGKIPVEKGEKEFVHVVPTETLDYPLTRDEMKSLEVDVWMKESLKAPVLEGDLLGNVKYKVDEVKVLSVELSAKEDILKKELTSDLF
jgi:serine-type D-Ala-D-Ala carboxypeptidase (penicillin-binding protein 5/6)